MKKYLYILTAVFISSLLYGASESNLLRHFELLETYGKSPSARKKSLTFLKSTPVRPLPPANQLCTVKCGETVFAVDKKSGLLRPLKYSDIVILTRSVKGFADVFSEVLMKEGIPVFVGTKEGYFETQEIGVLLDYLSVINNMKQDIPLAAVLKSYFGNMGTSLIEEVLQDIGYDKEKAEKLFRNIELNYNLGHFDGKQNVLGSIQLSLLDYLDKKCELLYEKNDIPGLNNTLSLYEQMIVTPDKLKLMLKNPDNYDLLTDSLLKLECIKSKYRVDTNDKEDVFLK